jgi:hypothetical protein
MKKFVGLMCAVALVLVLSTSVRAADGQISDAELAQFGLGGAEVVSDMEGNQIRGKFLFGPNFQLSVANLIFFSRPSEATARAANVFVASTNAANQILAAVRPFSPWNNPNVHVINFAVPFPFNF